MSDLVVVDHTSQRQVKNRLNDVFFKALVSNKEITISLLNAIFENYPLGNQIKVASFEYCDREIVSRSLDGKACRLDLIVQTDQGVFINVEVQLLPNEMVKRSLFYFSKLYDKQLQKSEQYEELNPCVIISIVNFELDLGTENYLTRYQLKELRENVTLTEDADLFFLELPKWKQAQSLEDVPDKIKNRLFRWLNYLTRSDVKLEQQIMEQDEIFKEAHKVEAKFCADDENWFAYLRREKYLHDEASRIPYIEAKAEKRGIEIGEKRGIEIGEKRGIEIGEKRGEKNGRMMEKLSIAKKMLELGKTLTEIKQLTDLTDGDLNAILND